MERGNIKLNDFSRFSVNKEIPSKKLEYAIKAATDKLLNIIEKLDGKFLGTHTNNLKYITGDNNTWVSGLYTGTLLLAYELTGNEVFLSTAKSQMQTYQDRFDKKIAMMSHDAGFIYTPSVVALYKLTGDEKLRQLALDVAHHLYSKIYSQKGGFIVRDAEKLNEEAGCRTMMDTLMNIPLFFWAYEETRDKKYFDAANSQINITRNYLIRKDGSSYHHYQFEVDTHKPIRGLTFQGHTDESCWTRGHSWAIYGLPVSYTYNNDKTLLPLHRDVTYFALNHLPKSNIPYYDYDFTEECDEARDSSAGLISACGMLEACKYLPDNAEEKKIYKNAALMIIEAVIDNCADYDKTEFGGLVRDVTCSAPHNFGINGCAPYGDFFYLEALLRCKNPEWKRYW